MEPVLTRYVRQAGAETLEFYLAHRGYEALRKALTLEPSALIEMVKASGLRGRGGAGFPAGLKWHFVPKDSPLPIYLCVNADESEPGTFKDHVLMERNPHLLIEGAAIACRAIGARVAYVYIRGRVPARAEGAGAGDRRGARARPARDRHPRLRLRLRGVRAPRRRRLRGGRGDRAHRVARGQAGAAAPQAALPGGGRPVRVPDGRQQRRDDLQRAVHRVERAGVVRGARSREERRAETLLRQRARRAAGRVRGVDARDAARADLRPRRRHPRRPGAQGGDPRRFVHQHHSPGPDRRRGELRRRRPRRVAARLGGDDRDGRHHLHGLARGEPPALLPTRVVRQVHAVPRRGRLDAEDRRPDRAGRGVDRRPHAAGERGEQHHGQDAVPVRRGRSGAGAERAGALPRRVRGARPRGAVHAARRLAAPWRATGYAARGFNPALESRESEGR